MSISNIKSLVYIVDDEFPIRDSLTDLLEFEGYSVISFDSSEAFLESYDPDQPGCLILDVGMPSMNGYELQQELSNRGFIMPIIFISGHVDTHESTKVLKGGSVSFLRKPFDLNLLLELINSSF